MEYNKRKLNEKKFKNWEEYSWDRKYWYQIKGKAGWRAKYVKEVDIDENTIKFYQEIYNDKGN